MNPVEMVAPALTVEMVTQVKKVSNWRRLYFMPTLINTHGVTTYYTHYTTHMYTSVPSSRMHVVFTPSFHWTSLGDVGDPGRDGAPGINGTDGNPGQRGK